jgi:hypothetical protein
MRWESKHVDTQQEVCKFLTELERTGGMEVALDAKVVVVPVDRNNDFAFIIFYRR